MFAAHDAMAFRSMPRLQNYFSGWSDKAIQARNRRYGKEWAQRRGDNRTCGAMARNLVRFYHTKVNRRFPGVPRDELDRAGITAQVLRQLSDIIRNADSSRVSDS